MRIRQIGVAILLSLLSLPVFAGDADLAWLAPTQNTDGTAIPATGPTSLDGFKIYYRLAGTTTDTVIDVTDQAARTYKVTNLGPGTWNFRMTAYNVAGAESDFSGTAFKDVIIAPLPPGTVFVTVEPAVYNLVKKTNGFVLIQVGTVPLNTNCDPNQSVNGYNVIPTTTVTWSGTVKPIVVVAKCSVR